MGNIQLHRVPMAKWLPPNGLTGKMHHMDARVGGGYKMSFTHFTTGKSHRFSGTYVKLQPGKRLRSTDQFDDPCRTVHAVSDPPARIVHAHAAKMYGGWPWGGP